MDYKRGDRYKSSRGMVYEYTGNGDELIIVEHPDDPGISGRIYNFTDWGMSI
jgi:hypothetical protein